MGDGACTRGGCCCWGGNGWPIPPTLPHPASQSPPCAMPHRPVRANSVRHLWVVVRISLAMSCKGYKKSSPASGPRHGSIKPPGPRVQLHSTCMGQLCSTNDVQLARWAHTASYDWALVRSAKRRQCVVRGGEMGRGDDGGTCSSPPLGCLSSG